MDKLGYEGIYQVASFHPQYLFAGSSTTDAANYTNRSPYPMLHLLREASVANAVEAFADAEAIYGANLRTLAALGRQGWDALEIGARIDAVARARRH